MALIFVLWLLPVIIWKKIRAHIYICRTIFFFITPFVLTCIIFPIPFNKIDVREENRDNKTLVFRVMDEQQFRPSYISSIKSLLNIPQDFLEFTEYNIYIQYIVKPKKVLADIDCGEFDPSNQKFNAHLEGGGVGNKEVTITANDTSGPISYRNGGDGFQITALIEELSGNGHCFFSGEIRVFARTIWQEWIVRFLIIFLFWIFFFSSFKDCINFMRKNH